MKAEQTVTRMSSFPLSLCFSWCEKAFQIMMWIDVQQLSPLLGPVRHLTGHRWQHYDGLGIVIQDACHLFTSRPSLISHHRPYNLAGTPPTPPPTPPAARHAIQDNTIHYNSFFFPPLPLTFLSLFLFPSYIPGLNTVNTFNALIYVLCSPISEGLGRCLLLSTSTPENWLGFIQTSQWEREGGSDLTCILLLEQWDS